MSDPTSAYWSLAVPELLRLLESTSQGLRQDEADRRLARDGLNSLATERATHGVWLFLNQFKSPLVLILIVAAIISAVVGEWSDAIIVLTIVLGSTSLGFVQEFRAHGAIEKLRSTLKIHANVVRDGAQSTLPAERVVVGDVITLAAGSLIPADAVVLEANDLFVSQAVLTGEVYPVERKPTTVLADVSLAERVNCVYMGTSVRSGMGRAVVVRTGKETVFGQIAERLRLRPPETEFERGVQRFGYLLTRVMLVMVVIVLSVNMLRNKPALDSLLFALALAVGLTPELLPAIISITLSRGAQRMAQRGVIVRHLNAIENFGSMDVLCTDKTGTLTEGVVQLHDTCDSQGKSSPTILRWAYLNASIQTGLANPLDEAICVAGERRAIDRSTLRKIDEIPYDFSRKRLSVIVADASQSPTMITKGALETVLSVCRCVAANGGVIEMDDARRTQVMSCYQDWGGEGYRVLGIAMKEVAAGQATFTSADEVDLTFLGFLLFLDPPKPDVAQTIADLKARGVTLKVITGDNRLVARHVAESVGLSVDGILTGSELLRLSDDGLLFAAQRTTLFAEVDPNQKERIILALKKMGYVVGYLGDGINDAPALHAADVGISVNTAVDVAKDAADLVLLDHNLDILRDGIDEGRRTFANTLKYVLTTISANFGNMFSMAMASLFLPFLPLLASQILLNNFMSDIPGTMIASDNVDREWIDKPHRWDTRFISRYMVLFGLVSSIFDLLTFAMLIWVFRASEAEFRTGWFVESLLTELVIAIVVRTRRVFYRSQPGRWLLGTTGVVIGITLLLPYLPVGSFVELVPLPAPMMIALLGLTALYVVVAEFAKKWFYSQPVNARFLDSAAKLAP